jgi:hypothetical protein
VEKVLAREGDIGLNVVDSPTGTIVFMNVTGFRILPFTIVSAAVWLTCVLGAQALNIVNHFSPLNGQRPRRQRTDYLILHTTEGPGKGSLAKVRRLGECHYFVDEIGKVFRIIDRHKVALHAGRSMWNGRTNIDDSAIGIEVAGYHNRNITAAQYAAVKDLVAELQGIYKITDARVLTHSMVAYGAPNQWHKHAHRGRKRCGMLFAKWSVRVKLGLTSQQKHDPDIKAGRLVNADPYLAKVLYGSAQEQERAAQRYAASDANIISPSRSAWDIARDKYKSPEVTYVFPSGKRLQGNAIKDWKTIPPGTRVILFPQHKPTKS